MSQYDLYISYFLYILFLCKHIFPHLPYLLIIAESVKCPIYFPVF